MPREVFSCRGASNAVSKRPGTTAREGGEALMTHVNQHWQEIHLFTNEFIILCGFELWTYYNHLNQPLISSAMNPVEYAHFLLSSDARNDYHDVIAIIAFFGQCGLQSMPHINYFRVFSDKHGGTACELPQEHD